MWSGKKNKSTHPHTQSLLICLSLSLLPSLLPFSLLMKRFFSETPQTSDRGFKIVQEVCRDTEVADAIVLL